MSDEKRHDETPAREPGEPDLQALFDLIHYREFKILLKPEAFADLQHDARDYWKVAKRVARENSAVVSEARDWDVPHVRQVEFLDTPAGDLYKRCFMLRRRTPLRDGRPAGAPEVTFKFRHTDVARAAAMIVRAAPQFESKEKFKEELLLEDRLGGMRSVFSHTARLREERWNLGDMAGDWSKVFPAIDAIGFAPRTPLRAIGRVRIEEVLHELGRIDFGGGREAEATLSVWRDAATGRVLIGEFSFETHFHHYGKIGPHPKLRSERFYRLLQQETGAWVALGTTKTALVYEGAGLGKVRAE